MWGHLGYRVAVCGVLRGGLGHVPHAHQGVGAVGTAQDAGSEHDGQGVGGHAVLRLLLGHPAEPTTNMFIQNNIRKDTTLFFTFL